MTRFVNPFARKFHSSADNAAKIKQWVRQYLSLPDDIVVSVNQVTCGEVGCPDVETVIGILRPGAPIQILRVLRPIADIVERDVEQESRRQREQISSDSRNEASNTHLQIAVQ